MPAKFSRYTVVHEYTSSFVNYIRANWVRIYTHFHCSFVCVFLRCQKHDILVA